MFWLFIIWFHISVLYFNTSVTYDLLGHHCHTFWIWKTSVTFLTGFSCWNENRPPSSWVGLPRPPSWLTLYSEYLWFFSASWVPHLAAAFVAYYSLLLSQNNFSLIKNNFSWKQWYVWNYNVKQSLVLLQYQTIRCVIRINKVQNHIKHIYSSPPLHSRQINKTQDLSATSPAHVMLADSDSVLWPDLTWPHSC